MKWTLCFLCAFSLLCAAAFPQSPAVDIPLTVNDGAAGSLTMRFGLNPSATDGIDIALGEQPLPPLPPSGIFDARFNLPVNSEASLRDYRQGSAGFSGTKIHEIQYQPGAGTVITIAWTMPANATGRLQDIILGTIIDVTMTGSGSYTVTNPAALNKLKMTIQYSLTPPPVVPPVVVLASPAKNATNQPPNLTFKWFKPSSQSPILKYWLEVATDTITNIGTRRDTAIADTFKTLTGLQYGTYYYWRVKAKNEAGWGPFNMLITDKWWKFRTVQSDAPAVPVLLLPLNGAVNQPAAVTLTWNRPAGAIKFRAQVAADSTFQTTLIDDTTLTDTTKQVAGLNANTKYYWRVLAAGASASSPFSAPFSFTTAAQPVIPAAPVLQSPLNGATGQGTAVVLTWGSVSGAVSYRAQVSKSSAFTTLFLDDSLLLAPAKTVSGLNPGTTYYWRVNAKNAAGTSVYSTVFLFTTSTGLTPPLPPMLLTPANGAGNQPGSLTISWSPSAGAETYRVQVSYSSTFISIFIDDSTVTGTGKAVTGLSGGMTFFWRVSAKNAAGTSAYSEVFNFSTLYVPVIPQVPQLALPVNGAINQPLAPMLMWTTSAGATTYHLQVSTANNFSTLTVDDSTITTNQRQISGLHYATTYYWRVSAASSAGASAYSSPFRFSTLELVPVELTSLSASPSGANILIRWSTATERNNRGFEVRRKSASGWIVVGFVPGAGTSTVPREYEFADTRPMAGINAYRLRQTDLDGGFEDSHVVETEFVLPSEFYLAQNYPNPFNPVTSIEYGVGSKEAPIGSGLGTLGTRHEALVFLKVYDMIGREVATLVNEEKGAGVYMVRFDASQLPGGVYSYVLRAGGYSAVRKMILLK